MTKPTKCRTYRGPDARHEFDPLSGWCIYGCGTRDDNRITYRSGDIANPGPEYTPDDIARLADELRRQEQHHDFEQQAFNI